MPTIGVEEEFFAVDAATGVLLPDGGRLLEAAAGVAQDPARFADELRRCQLEARTAVCSDLPHLRSELAANRRTLIDAGKPLGIGIAAAGLFPTGDWRNLPLTRKERHLVVAARYRRLAEEQVVSASHVHIGVQDRDTAVQVMGRVRPWLPLLAALAASSPYLAGEDSGYQSYRAMLWERWNMAGVPPQFSTWQEYRQHVDSLIRTETVYDAGAVYWDVRPGTRFPTVEIRCADACPTIDEVVAQAALSRGLVATISSEVERGEPGRGYREDLLRAARWRAARYGLAERLLDPFAAELVPATELLDSLLAYIDPALEAAGDAAEAGRLVRSILERGTSADRQRQAGDAQRAAALVVEETGRL